MFQRVTTHIFDGGVKRANKVTFNTLKHFLLSDQQQMAGGVVSHSTASIGKNYDLEPSQDRKATGPVDDTTPEELNMCRSGARKILQSFQSTIVEALQAKDRLKEGIISREDLQKTLDEQKVPELSNAELSLLLKMGDRGSKGYVSTDRFVTLL